MSTASTVSPSASFHTRPHSPAIHHHHRTYHHSPHPHTPSHVRQNGPKRSVTSSSTSLVAHNKGQGQIKSPEKREKEKERKRGRAQGSHADHSAEAKGPEDEHLLGTGPAGTTVENAIDHVKLPPTPDSTIKYKAPASPKFRLDSQDQDRTPTQIPFKRGPPQTPPSPSEQSHKLGSSLYAFPKRKSALSPPTLQADLASNGTAAELNHRSVPALRGWSGEDEFRSNGNGLSPNGTQPFKSSRARSTEPHARSPIKANGQNTEILGEPFGSRSESHIEALASRPEHQSQPPHPAQGEQAGHNVMPQRRLYAYNASSREEEAQRAALVDACEGLSSLCSQWHGSEYNKLKFGEKGAPIQYCPLTIAAPQHVQSIMMAQAMYEKEIYGPGNEAFDSMASSIGTESSFGTTQDGQDDEIHSGHRQGGMNQMFDDDEHVRKEQLSRDKLSQSLQSVDGSWVKDEDSFRPTEEEVQKEIRAEVQHHNPTNETPLRVVLPQSMAEEEGYEGMAVKEVKESEIELKNGQHVEMPNQDTSNTPDAKMQRELKQAMEDEIGRDENRSSQTCQENVSCGEFEQKAFKLKTSDTHPINVSMLLPFEAMPLFLNNISAQSDRITVALGDKKPLFCSPSDQVWQTVVSASQIGGNAPVPITAMPHPANNLGIGNLLLSSCPGKKVRLDGPVRGRAAICRDLKSDLARIKEMGVGCVICCLDDNELRFLGAPWEEYRARAAELGLQVLRIPMPEGLTPSCLKTFDGLVERVVQDYTLKGIHVLAHCRAGVGRAGLTACAWAIKMGIAGPKPGLEDQMLDLLDGRPDTQGMCENARVMSTVERVIGLIRRRRSVKAIETFEQVNFLASYVGWLRRESGETAASEAPCLG